MHDEEATSPRWKLNPKNFGSNIKSTQFLGSGGKNWGRSGFRKQQNFLGLTSIPAFTATVSRVAGALH